MTHLKTFDEQLTKVVNEDRQKDYGHPADHFAVASQLKQLVRTRFSGDHRKLHAIDVILDKIARLCHSPEHFDSWLDIAGYARTVMMIMDFDTPAINKSDNPFLDAAKAAVENERAFLDGLNDIVNNYVDPYDKPAMFVRRDHADR